MEDPLGTERILWDILPRSAERQMGRCAGMHAEIPLRTIAIDFRATLEHRLKYRQNLPHGDLIRSELKRRADEIAATNLSRPYDFRGFSDALELEGGGILCIHR